MDYIDALEEAVKAARIIFDVSSRSWDRANPVECPHGYIPRYPTHSWWCDECFGRLEQALEDVETTAAAQLSPG